MVYVPTLNRFIHQAIERSIGSTAPGMSPRDEWNLNVVYQPEWWDHYVESVLSHFDFVLGDQSMMVDIDWVDPWTEFDSDAEDSVDPDLNYTDSWDGDTEVESIGSSDTEYSGTGTKDDPIVLDVDD